MEDILGFIPSDQRKFSYNFVFGLALSIIRVAEKHGGRPYATGLFFSKKADSVLGKERVKRLRAFKNKVDHDNIMNPGKVIGSGPVGIALQIAGTLEPFIRPLGNSVTTLVGERPEKEIRGIPKDVAWYAYSCSQCGYCVDECDQSTGAAGKARVQEGNGTGFGSIWKAACNGTRRWSIRSFPVRPARCAICAVRHHCQLNLRG
ncbi:MAG TPA: hypothetical protein VKL21_07325 [Candidatus Methanoperedens sp.]|nr:hypothetical protein [Candidatus Methanoperedens sp.]